MSGIISWEDPPRRAGATAELAAIVKELRENPGRWAKVAENASLQDAERFRTGLRREPGFEVKRRATIDGHDVYIRYLMPDLPPLTQTQLRHSGGSKSLPNTPPSPSEIAEGLVGK